MGDSARAIIALLEGLTSEDLAADDKTRAAVLWHITVLGEAAAQLSDVFKDGHPEVPWIKASRLRNRIVHGYWSISTQIVHDVAADDLPPMVVALETLAGRLTEGSSAEPAPSGDPA